MRDAPASADSLVAVPPLIGLEVSEARDACHAATLVAVSDDEDGPALGARAWPGIYLVTAQVPEPGVLLERWGVVMIDFERRNGTDDARDRLPQEPPPHSLRAHAEPERQHPPVEEAQHST